MAGLMQYVLYGVPVHCKIWDEEMDIYGVFCHKLTTATKPTVHVK